MIPQVIVFGKLVMASFLKELSMLSMQSMTAIKQSKDPMHGVPF